MAKMISAVDELEDKLDVIIVLLNHIAVVLDDVHEKDRIRVITT